MRQEKYHIVIGKKRTTITVDTILSKLLAIRLGSAHSTEEGRIMVREWLQATLTDKLGDHQGRQNASQWARWHIIHEIADKDLLSILYSDPE